MDNVENSNDKKEPVQKEQRPKRSFNFYWIYGIIILVILSINLFQYSANMVKINPSEYQTMAAEGDVDHIVIVNDQVVKVYIKKDRLSKEPHKSKIKGSPISGPNIAGPHYAFNQGTADVQKNEIVLDAKKYNIPYEYETQDNWGREMLNWVLFFGVMIIIWIFVMRRIGGGGGPGGQIFNIGKSRAQVFEGSKTTNVTFNDVAGLAEAKEELQEIVDFLKTPKKYTDLGAKIPKGALLVGPPGTGKTLLAKAIAGEANVPFFSLSGSDFVEMFVGVGASRVRDLFKQAKEKAPSIIFIDEIDAIGRARGRSVSMGANDERENTLNQLLTEMDGFGTNSGVILIGATNRADVLDRALMRAGRFDRQIFVDMPDLNERADILRVHLKPLKMDINVDVDFLARQTPGFSGADIANICNEAALIAARKKKKQVDKQDFLDAVDRVIGGLEKKNKIITADEKKAIAYHEAGHATVSWLVEHASPLVKVTIVPRGRSLGAAWYLPEERHLTTAEQMYDEICAALGGRAAEDVMYGQVSTGALSDLEKVTKQAYAMVTMYGLNDRVGNVSYYDSSGQSEYTFGKPYSEKTAQTIDEEVSKLIELQYVRAKRILSENKDKLTALATQLLEKEVIFKEDLEKIFGDRQWVKSEPAPSNGNGKLAPAQPPAMKTPTPTGDPAGDASSEGLFSNPN
ncbi:MAG: ATP-dependent zinc metalloprotease FtsH [Flavobacteriales bacterium]|nr:ATP-dependent zinc metalloprotease FtsH [Flavobacteriales bacterium]